MLVRPRWLVPANGFTFAVYTRFLTRGVVGSNPFKGDSNGVLCQEVYFRYITMKSGDVTLRAREPYLSKASKRQINAT